MRNKNHFWNLTVGIALAVAIAGCDEDERVAQVAMEAADRQAQQNTEMAKVTSQVAEGSRKLVEADAQARQEIVKVHQELQSERATLGDQWNNLEQERQEIVADRRTESLVVPAVQAIGTSAVAVLAIGLCLFLLYGLRRTDDTDAQLGELLIHEIVSDEPRLLSLRHVPALPSADDEHRGNRPASLTDADAGSDIASD